MNFIEMIEENETLHAIYKTAIELNSINLSSGKLKVIGQALINELKKEYQDQEKIDYLSNEILTTLGGGK